MLDSKCWVGWLRRKLEICGYFHFSAKRQFSYFRHNLPFSKVENENEDGFYVKFDAESDGDADWIPKPCSDLPIATLKS